MGELRVCEGQGRRSERGIVQEGEQERKEGRGKGKNKEEENI